MGISDKRVIVADVTQQAKRERKRIYDEKVF